MPHDTDPIIAILDELASRRQFKLTVSIARKIHVLVRAIRDALTPASSELKHAFGFTDVYFSQPSFKPYPLEEGCTIQELIERYGIQVEELISANKLSCSTLLRQNGHTGAMVYLVKPTSMEFLECRIRAQDVLHPHEESSIAMHPYY